jgi:hypothetical protein
MLRSLVWALSLTTGDSITLVQLLTYYGSM